MLPWHSVAAARCQVLLALAQRHLAWCVFDPSPKDLFLLARDTRRSATRVRLSCSLKSLVSSFMRHDVVNFGMSTPHMSSLPFAPVPVMLDVFDDSVVHGFLSCLSWAERGFLERFEAEWPLVRDL